MGAGAGKPLSDIIFSLLQGRNVCNNVEFLQKSLESVIRLVNYNGTSAIEVSDPQGGSFLIIPGVTGLQPMPFNCPGFLNQGMLAGTNEAQLLANQNVLAQPITTQPLTGNALLGARAMRVWRQG